MPIVISSNVHATGNNSGDDCQNSTTIYEGQPYSHVFDNQQTDLFFDYTPSIDTSINTDTAIFRITYDNAQNIPFDTLQEIIIYERVNCSNLIFVANIQNNGFFEPANDLVVPGLDSNKNYLIHLKRDPNCNLAEENFKFHANQIIRRKKCKFKIPCDELVQNGNFEYTKISSGGIDATAFGRGEVCKWETIAGNPDYVPYHNQCNSNSAVALLWFQSNGTEAISNKLYAKTEIGATYDFSVRLGVNRKLQGGLDCGPANILCSNSHTVPNEVKVALVKKGDLLNIPHPKYSNIWTIPKQVIATVQGSQLKCSMQNFNFTTPAINDKYDRLIIYNGNSPFSIAYLTVIDDVSLRKTNLPARTIIPDGADVNWIKTNVSANSSTLANTTFEIQGKLTINDDFTFEDCNFLMVGNAEIVVNVAKKLYIKNTDAQTEYMKACNADDFWKGITVDGSLYIENQSTSSSNTSITISNMENGIILKDFPPFTLSNIDFDRNHRAIIYEGGPVDPGVESVTDCHFKCTSPLKQNNGTKYYPKYAIELKNLTSILAPDIYSINSKGVVFEGTGGGILIDGSNLQLTDVEFYNFSNILNIPGTPNVYEIAIEVLGGSTPQSNLITAIKNCEFSNNKTCIRTYNHTNIYVGDAIASGLNYNQTFIRISDNDDDIDIIDNRLTNFSSGIIAYNVSDVEIFDNILDMEKQTGSNYTSKNNIHSMGIGIFNFNYTGTVPEVIKIEYNTIKHSKIGIHAEFATTKIQDNTILDLNDNTSPPPGSCFPFSCPVTPAYGIRAMNTNNGYKLVRNLVKLDAANYTTDPKSNTDVVAISLENTATAKAIASNVNCNGVKNTGIGLMFSGSHESATKVLKNNMKDHSYGFVLSNNGDIGDVVGNNNQASDNQWLGSFEESHTYANNSFGVNCTLKVRSGGGSFEPIINAGDASSGYSIIRKVTGHSPNTHVWCEPAQFRIKSGNTNAQTQVSSKHANKTRTLIYQKGQNMKFAGDSAWTLSKQLLYWQIVNNDSILKADTLWKSFSDSMENSNLGKMLSKGNTPLLRGTNHFDMHLYNIGVILNRNQNERSLSKRDSLVLTKIAENCPYYDGIAVYQARSILSEYGYYSPINKCELVRSINLNSFARRKDGLNSTEVSQFKLFPNPTNGQFIIQYEIRNGEVYQFEIFDPLGRIIKSEMLVEGNLHKLKLENGQRGIYFYRLKRGDKVFNTGKLMVN